MAAVEKYVANLQDAAMQFEYLAANYEQFASDLGNTATLAAKSFAESPRTVTTPKRFAADFSDGVSALSKFAAIFLSAEAVEP